MLNVLFIYITIILVLFSVINIDNAKRKNPREMTLSGVFEKFIFLLPLKGHSPSANKPEQLIGMMMVM